MPHRRGSEAGFTLVEVLVSLVLLAFLTTIVFQGLRFSTRAWTSAVRKSDAAASSDAARTVLRQAITMAYPDFASDNIADRTIAFEGTSTVLTLVTPLPAAIDAGVLADEQFLVVPARDGNALVMRWQLHLPASDAAAPLPIEQVTLLDQAAPVRFSYFGPPAPRQPSAWLDRWTGRASLPELVRVQFGPSASGAPRWPDLVVEPKATANTPCVYDPGEITCRRTR